MIKPTISILHPSRSRPEQAYITRSQWIGYADKPFDIQYILSFDYDDPCYYDYINLFQEQSILLPGYNKTAIEAINYAARVCSGDLIIVVSDDFDCPMHWDTLLLNQLAGKEEFLLKTRDGIQKTLLTLPIMDRKYYERFGYIYEPGYKHMYADQELTAVAAMTGKLIYSDLLFSHNHYTTGKTPMDEINKKNDATYPQGLDYFNERLKTNFGIENPVIEYSQIKWH